MNERLNAQWDTLAERVSKAIERIRKPRIKNKPGGLEVDDQGWLPNDIHQCVRESLIPGFPEDHDSESTILKALQPLPGLVGVILNPWSFDATIVDRDSMISAVKLGARVLCSTPLPDWFVSIGFGVSPDTDIAMRAPAYVGPIVSLLTKMKYEASDYVRQRFEPRIRIFSAANLAPLSQVDRNKALSHSLYSFALIDEFLREFHKQVVEYEQISYEVFSFSEAATTEGNLLADELLGSSDESAKVLVSMAESFGKRHKASSKEAVLYAAFHSFMFLDWHADQAAVAPFAAVSYGGKPERAFNVGRRAAIRFKQESARIPNVHFPESIQVATNKLFRRAPYYFHSDDISVWSADQTDWSDRHAAALASPEVGRDYRELPSNGDSSRAREFCRVFAREFPQALFDDPAPLAARILDSPVRARLDPRLVTLLEDFAPKPG